MTATVPDAPLLATVSRVELGAVGKWNIANMPDWQPTPDDMASAVAALDCPAVRRPVLKLGHSGKAGTGDPTIGFVDNLAITEEGQVLVGDWAGIPAWLVETDAEGHNVLSSAYPDRSGEWEHNYTCQLGHLHPFVLHAMSLLGVERPGIGTLESLHDLFANAPKLEEPVTLSSTDGTVQSAATTDDVRRAFYDGPGSNWSLFVREMYVDPPELIVQNDEDSSLQRIGYSIDKAGAVTFAEPQAVKVEYVAARAAASAPVIAYASHAEARPGTPPSSPSPSASGSTQERSGSMTDLLADLRKKLGVADPNATEEMLLAALDEALLERAGGTPPAGAPPAGTPPVAPPPVVDERTQVAASVKLPPGVVAIDQETLDRIMASSKAAQDVVDKLSAQERDGIIASAVSDGKIPRSRVEHYRTQFKLDPEGTKQALSSMPKNMVPIEPVGHGGDGEDIDREFAGLFPPTQER